ncbi:MAG: AI-2E family transporter [Gammaproteobacteria bacterium]
MNTNNDVTKNDNNSFTMQAIETTIRLGLIFLLLSWCLDIIRPFILPVIWGIIIAVAIYPLFIKLRAMMGGRNKLAATVYTLVMVGLLVTPTVMISGSLIDSSQNITENIQQGTLVIPPPNKSVNEWPLIGEKIFTIWSQAATNLESTLKTYSAEVKKIGKVIISAAAGAGGTVLQFVLSIIISGIFLAMASGGHSAALKISQRLAGETNGKKFNDLTIATIRSVAQGVLGVAVIQAVLAAIGLYFMDVPAWGLLTILILVLAIAQLPPILILGPIIAYVFSYADTTPAILFTIWSIIVSASDGFLKPLFLGRGMATPMLVILLGAIGGMMLSGIIGLFIGAVVLALGYELFIAWLDNDVPQVEEAS